MILGGHVEVQNDMQQTIYEIKLTKASDTYLEPSQTSMMDFFAKTLNGLCKKALS